MRKHNVIITATSYGVAVAGFTTGALQRTGSVLAVTPVLGTVAAGTVLTVLLGMAARRAWWAGYRRRALRMWWAMTAVASATPVIVAVIASPWFTARGGSGSDAGLVLGVIATIGAGMGLLATALPLTKVRGVSRPQRQLAMPVAGD